MIKFKAFIKPFSEKLENLLKFGRYTRVSGENGQLQEMQLKNIRNLDECVKMGQFGFNSKAPIGSRAIVSRIGNDKIVISNEHIESIIDISTGNTVIYNQSGHTIKIEGDTITTTAPNIVNNCTNFTVNSTNTNINATTKLTVNTPDSNINGGTVKNDGVPIDKTHTHLQNDGNDAGGGVQTNPPTS